MQLLRHKPRILVSNCRTGARLLGVPGSGRILAQSNSENNISGVNENVDKLKIIPLVLVRFMISKYTTHRKVTSRAKKISRDLVAFGPHMLFLRAPRM